MSSTNLQEKQVSGKSNLFELKLFLYLKKCFKYESQYVCKDHKVRNIENEYSNILRNFLFVWLQCKTTYILSGGIFH